MYGGEVHDIGIALVYATPAFYCNTTDSLLFANKWHEMWVTTAGHLHRGVDLLAGDALLDPLLSGHVPARVRLQDDALYRRVDDLPQHQSAHQDRRLLRADELVEIPELREESFRYIGAAFQRHILRLPVEVPAVSRRKRRIYWIYGTLALALGPVVMRFIGGLFYNLYTTVFSRTGRSSCCSVDALRRCSGSACAF